MRSIHTGAGASGKIPTCSELMRLIMFCPPGYAASDREMCRLRFAEPDTVVAPRSGRWPVPAAESWTPRMARLAPTDTVNGLFTASPNSAPTFRNNFYRSLRSGA
jgi:hypothetical protein